MSKFGGKIPEPKEESAKKRVKKEETPTTPTISSPISTGHPDLESVPPPTGRSFATMPLYPETSHEGFPFLSPHTPLITPGLSSEKELSSGVHETSREGFPSSPEKMLSTSTFETSTTGSELPAEKPTSLPPVPEMVESKPISPSLKETVESKSTPPPLKETRTYLQKQAKTIRAKLKITDDDAWESLLTNLTSEHVNELLANDAIPQGLRNNLEKAYRKDIPASEAPAPAETKERKKVSYDKYWDFWEGGEAKDSKTNAEVHYGRHGKQLHFNYGSPVALTEGARAFINDPKTNATTQKGKTFYFQLFQKPDKSYRGTIAIGSAEDKIITYYPLDDKEPAAKYAHGASKSAVLNELHDKTKLSISSLQDAAQND